MNQVSGEFLLAAWRLVEYLERDEAKDFCSNPTPNHIYNAVRTVRDDLTTMGLGADEEPSMWVTSAAELLSSPERLAEALRQSAQRDFDHAGALKRWHESRK
jgi:hypothetical protein